MAFYKNLSLQQLWLGALNTFLRFPMVLLSAITGTATVIYLIEFNKQLKGQEHWLAKLIVVCSLGIILFFTLELLVRRYKLAQRTRVLTWLGGLVFLTIYYFILPDNPELKPVLRHLALVLALHLMSSYAMFLNRRQENAFWEFNKSLFLRVLTSVLYSGVLFVGLVVAIVALDQLFSIKVHENIYPELWFFMVGVFNTWFFLAGVPGNVEEMEQTQDYPKGLKVFTQFVLLPLVTIYLLILYAYFGKIAVQWEWPQGWVSVLVLVFSVVGILSLLLIHPIRNMADNTWIRTYSKWFYRALFPLIILLALAIWRRVSEYGITEERYVVLALAIWLLITVLYFIFSRTKNIKFIPVTLSLIALVAAFGPVNMFVVSEWSQVNRLRNLLQEQGIMVDNKVQAKHGPVAKKAAAEINSIVDYLAEYHNFEKLEGWFVTDLGAALDSADDGEWAKGIATRTKVLQLMGVKEVTNETEAITNQYFNYSLSRVNGNNTVYATNGFNYMAEVSLPEYQKREELKLGKLLLIVTLEENALHFQMEQEILRLDLNPIIRKLGKESGNLRTQKQLTYSVKGSKATINIVLEDITGVTDDKLPEINSLELLLFVQVQ